MPKDSMGIARAFGRTKAARRCHEIAMEMAEDVNATYRDRLAALTSCRQEREQMRKEEEFVAPVDRKWIEEQVKRAEQAAEKIDGGRPRRVEAPGTTRAPGTRH